MKPIWLRKLAEALDQDDGKIVWAAVALLLRGGKEQEILFLKRAEIDGDPWSGDVAFPGGKKNDEDRDLKVTVLRETLEETGIDLNAADYVGNLPIVFSNIQPEKGVLPMVFYLETLQEIRLSEEHTDYRWIPLSKLMKSRDRIVIKKRMRPVFVVDDILVWGLTYRIINSFIRYVNLLP